MFIKRALQRLAEKITGRRCCCCRYNVGGKCTHPSDAMYMLCWHGITKPGYEKRPPRYLNKDGHLTVEEQHQLQKIKATLQEAEDTARDGDLLGGKE